MAGPVARSAATVVRDDSGGRSYGKSLGLLASLFCMWGFITVINNTLLPHRRSVFDLSSMPSACELYVLFHALWGSRPIGAVP